MTDFKKVQVICETENEARTTAKFLDEKIGCQINVGLLANDGSITVIRYSRGFDLIGDYGKIKDYKTYSYNEFKEAFMDEKKENKWGTEGWGWDDEPSEAQEVFMICDYGTDYTYRYNCSLGSNSCDDLKNFSTTKPVVKKWIPATEEHIGEKVKVSNESQEHAINKIYSDKLLMMYNGWFVTEHIGKKGGYSKPITFKYAMVQVEV